MNDIKFFVIRDGVVFTEETNGISLIDHATNNAIFIDYPEAAVWCVLNGSDDLKRNIRVLSSVLQKKNSETLEFIEQCLAKWKSDNLIR